MFKKMMILGAVGLLLSLDTVWGATLRVPGDYGTIQKAMDAAVSGDTVLVAPGTYVENIDFKGKAIALMSEKGATETFIDGNESGSVVTCVNGEDKNSILDGFTLFHGYADRGGGMYNCGSSPTVKNCTFNENIAKSLGGGMGNEYSDPTVLNCTFTNGRAKYGGGGMQNYISNSTVKYCTFIGNTVDYHGGAMWNGESNPAVIQCTFVKNTANTAGGVFNILSNPTIANCIFEKNMASSGGGGMDNEDESCPTLTDCTFLENHAVYDGGGMKNGKDCNPTVTHCTFSANEARFGGGMINYECGPIVTHSTFSANTALYTGGGMNNYDCSNLLVAHCIFTDNLVTDAASYVIGGGGGMYNFMGTPTMKNCVFNGNAATGLDAYGGGMHNILSSPTAINCFFSENEACYGGGMCNWDNSNPTVTSCTFFDNKADSGGGMFIESQSNPTVTNTVLWGDDALAGPEIWMGVLVSPSSLTIRYSDVEGGQSSVHVNGATLNWGPGMIDADPLFVDSTNGDFHLTYPSPCKDGADNSAVMEIFDFEGDPRIAYGSTDMGADEFHTHLYYTGDATPGGSIEVKLVGQPGTSPVILCAGSGVLDIPIPTEYGDWFLDFPLLVIMGMGSIASPAGVSVLPYIFDPSFPAMDIPIQSLIGLELTNLCVITVE